MDDLARWLGEQFDEDERPATDARADGDGRWTYVETKGGDHKVVDSLGYTITGHYDIDAQPYFCEPHIAEWDPARVLREIDAKRKLLDKIVNEVAEFDGMDPMTTMINPDVGDDLLKLLALPYADRPGYAEAVASVE